MEERSNKSTARSHSWPCAAAAFIAWSGFCAPALAEPGRALSDLIEPGAELVKLAGGFGFLEGPEADDEGNLYFTDIPNNNIHIWTVDGALRLFRDNSGGANGLYFDANGDLLVCEGINRQVTRIGRDGEKAVLARHYEGKRLNSPNDLWIDPQGGVYFTDPRYGDQQGRELDGHWVFYIPPDGGAIVKVIDDLEKPNGILGTPDGKQLYVADRSGNANWVYDIEGDGTLSNKRYFSEEGSDGMTMDRHGNIYVSSPMTEPHFAVSVFNRDGEKLGEIVTPEKPGNMHFAGADGRTLFIVARTSLYSIRMKTRGAVTPDFSSRRAIEPPPGRRE